MLTPEEQAELDRLSKLKAESDKKSDKLDEDKIAKMTPDELKSLVLSLTDKKRDANSEAGDWRKKAEKLQTEKDEADRIAKEADMTATDKLKERDLQVEKLTKQNENQQVLSDAKVSLLADGYPEKIVNLGLKDIDPGNAEQSIRDFKKEFKDYKDDGKPKPDPPKNPSSQPEDDKPGINPFNQAESAVNEMRQSAENK